MDFVVVKVNGRNVSQSGSSNSDAMQALLRAGSDPLVIEVVRRPTAPDKLNARGSLMMTSTATTQTEGLLDDEASADDEEDIVDGGTAVQAGEEEGEADYMDSDSFQLDFVPYRLFQPLRRRSWCFGGHGDVISGAAGVNYSLLDNEEEDLSDAFLSDADQNSTSSSLLVDDDDILLSPLQFSNHATLPNVYSCVDYNRMLQDYAKHYGNTQVVLRPEPRHFNYALKANVTNHFVLPPPSGTTGQGRTRVEADAATAAAASGSSSGCSMTPPSSADKPPTPYCNITAEKPRNLRSYNFNGDRLEETDEYLNGSRHASSVERQISELDRQLERIRLRCEGMMTSGQAVAPRKTVADDDEVNSTPPPPPSAVVGAATCIDPGRYRPHPSTLPSAVQGGRTSTPSFPAVMAVTSSTSSSLPRQTSTSVQRQTATRSAVPRMGIACHRGMAGTVDVKQSKFALRSVGVHEGAATVAAVEEKVDVDDDGELDEPVWVRLEQPRDVKKSRRQTSGTNGVPAEQKSPQEVAAGASISHDPTDNLRSGLQHVARRLNFSADSTPANGLQSTTSNGATSAEPVHCKPYATVRNANYAHSNAVVVRPFVSTAAAGLPTVISRITRASQTDQVDSTSTTSLTAAVAGSARTSCAATDVVRLRELYTKYADVMYTIPANLEHTISVQQALFSQQLRGDGGSSDFRPASATNPPAAVEPAMEWVVRRRSDGTRYITRRPVARRQPATAVDRARRSARRRAAAEDRRRRVYSESAAAVASATTDDDAAARSEVKLGRYWTREERRRQVLEARQRRLEQQSSIQTPGVTTAGAAATTDAVPDVVELSRSKSVRYRNKEALDDFTTLNELLVLGQRNTPTSNVKTYNQLLSVTTV